MKTLLVTLVALIAFGASESSKSKRGSVELGYTSSQPIPFEQSINLGYANDLSGSQSGWKGLNIPLQQSGVDTYLPLNVVNAGDYNLKVNLPPPHPSLSILTNSLDKPVMESQEIVPQPPTGTAVIPRMPPPATPVNAVASNIPAQTGAVFLGSGSLGVVNLGNGAYALGSGSLGYSGNRAQPRPTGMVPVYPPLPASPNLIPAAVPSPAPLQQLPPITNPQVPNNLDFNHPLFNVPQVPIIDQNGYEYLPPNRVGFGMPNPRPLRPRLRQQFATPTALQLQPQAPQNTPTLQFAIPLQHPTASGIASLG